MWTIIKSILALLLSYIFTVLIGIYPNFPLDAATFTNLIMWLLALNIPIKYAINRIFERYNIAAKVDSNFWNMVKTAIALIASYLFSMLINKYPNFPLTDKLFINLILWLCALFLPIVPLTEYFIKFLKRTWSET